MNTSLNPPNSTSDVSQTVPKQVVDIVDLANYVDNVSRSYRRQLELDTLSTEQLTSTPQITKMFSNIEMDGVLLCGKHDIGAKINAMPLNVYDQLNMKLKGKLQLNPCSDVKVVGYSK